MEGANTLVMHMKTFSEKEIEERFQKLSSVLVEAMYSADNARAIVKLSGKYSITGRKTSNVAGEIGYVILGLTKPEEISSRLSERLDLKPSDAALLTKDVYQNVLKPLATELKRVHGFDLSEGAFDAKSPLVAPHTEPQKPPALVIPPRPVVQQTQPTPRPSQPPPPPLRPVPPPQPRTFEQATQSSPPSRAPEPRAPFTPLSRAPIKPPDIPRQASAPPPPAPPPALPPEQVEPRPLAIARAPQAPPMPPRPSAPRESPIAPPLPPKPPTLPEPRSPRNIFSPQMSGPLEPQREPARPAQEKPTPPLQPRVFTPKRPASPRDIDDPYRETVAPQEKELQQKRDAVSDPRGREPPFQVRKGEPPYVNPKIPPIDLREDASRPSEPPAPPDPHWEKLT